MKAAEKTLPLAQKEINPSLFDKNRFWNKVDKSRGPDACWPWTAHRFDKAYGCFYLKGRVVRAHRVAWVLTNGQIPQSNKYHGICVCHRCDNPGCCNPSHLFLGTNADNVADREKKHRNTPGEANTSAKLTNDRVAKIIKAYATGKVSHEDLARQFGVSSNTISRVTNRQSWKHLPFAVAMPAVRVVKPCKPICGEENISSKLTTAKIISIRSSYGSGTANLNQLATRFGVHPSTVWEIVHHKSWKHVTDPLADIW